MEMLIEELNVWINLNYNYQPGSPPEPYSPGENESIEWMIIGVKSAASTTDVLEWASEHLEDIEAEIRADAEMKREESLLAYADFADSDSRFYGR